MSFGLRGVPPNVMNKVEFGFFLNVQYLIKIIMGVHCHEFLIACSDVEDAVSAAVAYIIWSVANRYRGRLLATHPSVVPDLSSDLRLNRRGYSVGHHGSQLGNYIFAMAFNAAEAGIRQ
jgi:hypothetical protein